MTKHDAGASRLALIALLALGSAGAVAGPPAGAPDTAPVRRGEVDDATLERLAKLHFTESETVRLVLLPTTVRDRKGRIVRGLEREDFKVWEDQVPQEIRYFSSEAQDPISLAFLLDLSGSMRQLDKLTHAKEAIRFFLRHLRQDDRFALIGFADEQVAWITEFTDDRVRFRRRLEVQEGYGRTALHDAVAAAPRLVSEEIKGRKAIVLITDGVDNASRLDLDDAVALARTVNVPIYAIGFLSVPESVLSRRAETTNLEVLRRVAEETGGHLFAVNDPVELKEAIVFLETELRFQYMLGYYPARQADGSFREIRVETPPEPRFQVRTRTGYHATR